MNIYAIFFAAALVVTLTACGGGSGSSNASSSPTDSQNLIDNTQQPPEISPPFPNDIPVTFAPEIPVEPEQSKDLFDNAAELRLWMDSDFYEEENRLQLSLYFYDGTPSERVNLKSNQQLILQTPEGNRRLIESGFVNYTEYKIDIDMLSTSLPINVFLIDSDGQSLALYQMDALPEVVPKAIHIANETVNAQFYDEAFEDNYFTYQLLFTAQCRNAGLFFSPNSHTGSKIYDLSYVDIFGADTVNFLKTRDNCTFSMTAIYRIYPLYNQHPGQTLLWSTQEGLYGHMASSVRIKRTQPL